MNSADQQSQGDWNIMVYMAADDVLANFAIESLKQLRRAAGDGVVVAAQLDVDGPFARQRLRRFIFDKPGNGNQDADINQNVVTTLDPATNMVDPRNLTDFIVWAYQQSKQTVKHHCLVLWGHGPELLAESAPAGRQILKKPVPGGNGRQYLTAPELAGALEAARKKFDFKFDIIGLDACSSSIAELAAELAQYAGFMVASQEDVPDMSFPYAQLLPLFQTNKNNVQGICQIGVEKYIASYQNYIFGSDTDTSKVTLAGLNLRNFETVMNAITYLVQQLLAAKSDPELRCLIFEARKAAHGFVAGLFVDLCDFCNQLKPKSKNAELAGACQDVIDSLSKEKHFVVANEALDPSQSHGLSIYFPYLADDQPVADLTKGDTDILAKGDTDILAKGDTDILAKIRKQRITETEAYYSSLKLHKETQWYEFIQSIWSRTLAERLKPDELDTHYSAQQCTKNLLDSWTSSLPPNPPPPPPPSSSGPKDDHPPGSGPKSGQTNSYSSV